MMKFTDFPVVMLDLYGRERHPEYTQGESFDEETYGARRERIVLMEKTFQYVENGARPDNRIVLVDVDQINVTERTGSTTTVATAKWGQRAQGAWIVDLNGKIIASQVWERPEQLDEVLSHIFDVEVGL